jgi:protein-S-isoprenylcysteine O-methyltransferase Ste14
MSLGLRATIRAVVGFAFYSALFFGTAGTFDYWEAWVFMGTLFIPAILALIYFVRADPELLKRRMRMREERTPQKVIMLMFTATWLLVVVLPGLDHRFDWSAVPAWLVIFADVVVLASYTFVVRVMLENRYASRTIGVEEGQELVTTGLYALVRHPMYLGILPMTVFVPLALGSWWAVIPALAIPPFLVMRILDEEEVLKEGLPGYVEYVQKTRSRLIPGVW